jgi:hypothetical protein
VPFPGSGHGYGSRVKSARATLILDQDDSRRFHLPADGTPSLIFVFREDRQLGARAYSQTGDDFAPGTSQENVRLDFWAHDDWTDVVVPGAEFVVWYGGDVGRETITHVM